MLLLDSLPFKLFLPILVLYTFNFIYVSSAPLLVISFDGFRYDYLDMYPTPNFHRVATTGVRAKWMTSSFVSKTFPNHFSIITGLFEESHGIVGNSMFDPDLNETFDVSNEDPRWWYNGVSVPIWVANQKAGTDRHSGSVMWVSTSVPYYGKHITYLSPFNVSVPWKERLDIALTWLTADKDPANLVLLYIEEPDVTGHKFGPRSPQVGDKVIAADKLIGYLLDQLELKKLTDKLNFILLSDHGMAEVPYEKTIYLDKILDRSLYRQFGHSPVWNILPEKGQEKNVHSKLLAGTLLFPYTLYEKESVPMEYHYRRNRRIMPFVIEAEEGWDLAFNETWKRPNTTGGNHGYNNSLPSMHPIFLAHGPSFKKGYVADPFLNVDVYPLMCDLLELPSPKLVNGSLEGVKSMLAHRISFSSGTWIVVAASLLCVCLAAILTGAVVSAACKPGPPTISFVNLNNMHSVYRDEPSTGEEQCKLLNSIDATD